MTIITTDQAGTCVVSLHDNWGFKPFDAQDAEFRSVAQFPTNIHLDLYSHGLIPNPWTGKNEDELQWVGEVAWLYQTKFYFPAVAVMGRASTKVVLAFDGLDTFATVLLNTVTILHSNNMFVPARVDVSEHIRQNEMNELMIKFDSAWKVGQGIVAGIPKHRWGCWNGDVSRLAVRKAQYHWVHLLRLSQESTC